MINNNISQKDSDAKKGDESVLKRRLFLRSAGIATAVGTLAIGACKDDDDDMVTPPAGTVDLGKDDVGILNYAYALEQLEAAFYEQVVKTPYTGITAAETTILTDIRDHEIIHRDFFKAAITGATNNVLPTLEFQYPNVNFNDRSSVLATAKALEDTGVAAYNGAGRYITNPTYLVLAGKIVSVEARHASAIRDLINPLTAAFSGDDVVDPVTGLDVAKEPKDVVMAAGGFIKTPFTWKERGIN